MLDYSKLLQMVKCFALLQVESKNITTESGQAMPDPFKSFRLESSLSSPGHGFNVQIQPTTGKFIALPSFVSLWRQAFVTIPWDGMMLLNLFSFIIFIFPIFSVICWARSPFIAVMTKFSFVLYESEAVEPSGIAQFHICPISPVQQPMRPNTEISCSLWESQRGTFENLCQSCVSWFTLSLRMFEND